MCVCWSMGGQGKLQEKYVDIWLFMKETATENESAVLVMGYA